MFHFFRVTLCYTLLVTLAASVRQRSASVCSSVCLSCHVGKTSSFAAVPSARACPHYDATSQQVLVLTLRAYFCSMLQSVLVKFEKINLNCEKFKIYKKVFKKFEIHIQSQMLWEDTRSVIYQYCNNVKLHAVQCTSTSFLTISVIKVTFEFTKVCSLQPFYHQGRLHHRN